MNRATIFLITIPQAWRGADHIVSISINQRLYSAEQLINIKSAGYSKRVLLVKVGAASVHERL